MMLKGSVYQRRRGSVRQYGVTVNGSTHLVTSGDLVDEETLYALIAAGAVLVICVLASVISMWKVVRLDPADVFKGA